MLMLVVLFLLTVVFTKIILFVLGTKHKKIYLSHNLNNFYSLNVVVFCISLHG
jgi:hypothetical protein